MLTVREAYQRTRDALRSVYDSGEARAVADLLFERMFHLQHKDILLRGEVAFLPEHELTLATERLMKHEPVQYVCGYDIFRGLKLRLNKYTLIPRPETEELLEWIFSEEIQEPHLIADLCTGSGCIAMALRNQYPKADIFASDVSEAALSLAAASELDNFDTSRIHWLRNDLLLEPLNMPLPDLVVCNPPYIMFSEQASIAEHVLNYEPHEALFVYNPDPLLFYKQVIKLFGHSAKSRLYFELNPMTAGDLQEWCHKEGLHCVVRKDMSGKERFARITV